jgi:hypothetical protein
MPVLIDQHFLADQPFLGFELAYSSTLHGLLALRQTRHFILLSQTRKELIELREWSIFRIP